MLRYRVIFHRYLDVFQLNACVRVEENRDHVYHSMVHNDVSVSAIRIRIQYDDDNPSVVDSDCHVPVRNIILICEALSMKDLTSCFRVTVAFNRSIFPSNC